MIVLDTNVRRVLARTVSGVEFPATAVTRAERDVATSVLPDDDATAAWIAAGVKSSCRCAGTARSVGTILAGSPPATPVPRRPTTGH